MLKALKKIEKQEDNQKLSRIDEMVDQNIRNQNNRRSSGYNGSIEKNKGRSSGYNGSIEGGAENITVSDQDRSTVLHANSTANVE